MFSIENTQYSSMSSKMVEVDFKRVPALDKCFNILDLIGRSKKHLGISDISNALGYHRSTVFNIVYTLTDLGILEQDSNGMFHFGVKLYALGKIAANGSELISIVHPHLENISQQTKFSAFLGIRSGLKAIIIDKVDSNSDIKVSSEIGMKIPLLAGAGGKVLLSQLTNSEVDRILSENKLRKFTPFSCTDKKTYKELIKKAREENFAFDDEEYIEGIRALSVPLNLNKRNLQAAIWTVGLKSQITDDMVMPLKQLLQEKAREIETRLQ